LKINKQFLRISVIAFVLTLVTQIFSVVIFSVIRGSLRDPGILSIMLLSYLHSSISYTIGPILIFTVFYLIGKKPNLMFELKSILSALLIGNIVSLFVSAIIYSAEDNEISVSYIVNFTGQSMLIFLPMYVFSALASLSIGYIRLRNLTMKAEPEPSSNI